MIFNSLNFALFFTIVFLLYWLVFNKTAKSQNLLLLLASIFFYAVADWKFISLLAASGFVNFYLAKKIAQEEDESKARKFYFYSGIIFNIGVLLYFKYFNFFIQSFVDLFNYGGGHISFTPFHILLPLGISFITFQLIGYLIDVNNEEIEPINDQLGFFAYLTYFPKILSGPIERVKNFMPQIEKRREFDPGIAMDGLRQILWGLFKKLVIADNCLAVVDVIFNDYGNLPGSTLLIGAVLYSIGLYADFSGFADMACGISKLLNIRITNNFAFPFFSTNIGQFWRKWHISLTSWMMDYVYTPLSFILRRYKKTGLIASVLFTFVLVGLWHGANWTFVVFGLFHGLYFIPLILRGTMSKNEVIANGKLIPSISEFTRMAMLFLLVAVTTVFFRSNDVFEAFSYLNILFSGSLLSIPQDINPGGNLALQHPVVLIGLIGSFFLVEWIGRCGEYGLANIAQKYSRLARWSIYGSIIFLIGMFMRTTETPFIYIRF